MFEHALNNRINYEHNEERDEGDYVPLRRNVNAHSYSFRLEMGLSISWRLADFNIYVCLDDGWVLWFYGRKMGRVSGISAIRLWGCVMVKFGGFMKYWLDETVGFVSYFYYINFLWVIWINFMYVKGIIFIYLSIKQGAAFMRIEQSAVNYKMLLAHGAKKEFKNWLIYLSVVSLFYIATLPCY